MLNNVILIDIGTLGVIKIGDQMHGGTPVIENMGIIMIEVSDFKLV